MPIQGPIRVITENRCNACPPEPVYFDIARSIYSYHDDRVKNTIIALKYHYQTELAVPLAQLMLHGYHTYYRDIHFDGIIPIPLHRKRFKEREFNQAALIVDLLSKKLEIPILNDVVIRQKQTMPQASLAVKKRMRNLKGAFENIHPEQTQGKKFLVVDDVFTTGATTNEVCAALRYGKTSYLAVLTLARAVDL